MTSKDPYKQLSTYDLFIAFHTMNTMNTQEHNAFTQRWQRVIQNYPWPRDP